MPDKAARATFERLSEDMIETINLAILRAARETGFGEVRIVVEEGVPKYFLSAPSIPFRKPTATPTM